jgi:serine/threonine protein kinase|mmetsp:Transcript_12066/g.18664  ORF Transcript_12066/g.18664 Transcript_12066/m.18664 type:complete len:499 (-) Transcript_12066:257-1753(-)|eukprot:CAMPEP_0195292730 /NCGR_PEP_ID=MMETSP0707-20130614/10753_1 /TAXON_ID=33640 /ORGANISM="Asterionellopsis glacialis, Strain CCMP134" /LENGTH=498 /DNA_ID=CAMNT_0040353275 /DNA_START=315 /DNA_END=1811 /DNA_ORIENTATION=+
MGTNHSKNEVEVDTNEQSNGAPSSTKDAFIPNSMSRMDSEDEDCQCRPFSFCVPTTKSGSGRTKQNSAAKKKQRDILGTPIPDTPLIQRLRRREIIEETNREQLQHQQQQYQGLEKEKSYEVLPGSSHTSSSIFDEYERMPSAVVHEGKDVERELHEKYELAEVLGVGSTSTVHRCMNRSTQQSYACKIIDKQHIEERFQGMMEQFHREITALRSLKHPNIIRLYDVYVTNDKIFIVMELMEGGELFDYVVEKGTLNEEEAARIVRKVTSALVYMHSKNIIHRDLKPENLLLRHKPRTASDVEVKIIDFGLSKCMVEPVARSFLGTRGYLAPEMLQRRDYSRAVDTWALGVIAFVLLCGCLPFDDDSQTVPSDALVQAKFVLRFPRWAQNLSASAKDLLTHLLDINPRTRYTAEQALKHPWIQGKTAPAKNLLASPGRLMRTPNSKRGSPGTPVMSGTNGTITTSTVVHVHANRTQANLISPAIGATRKRTLVRKTSI